MLQMMMTIELATNRKDYVMIAILSSAAAILESKQSCLAALKNLLNAGNQSVIIMLPNTLNVVLFRLRLHKLVASFFYIFNDCSVICMQL